MIFVPSLSTWWWWWEGVWLTKSESITGQIDQGVAIHQATLLAQKPGWITANKRQ
jgi:hypothetical protein